MEKYVDKELPFSLNFKMLLNVQSTFQGLKTGIEVKYKPTITKEEEDTLHILL